MKIAFTFHAKQRMRRRGISEEMVNKTLLGPGAVSQGNENKKIAYKEFEGKVVEVVYVEEKGEYVVISVRWG